MLDLQTSQMWWQSSYQYICMHMPCYGIVIFLPRKMNVFTQPLSFLNQKSAKGIQ